MPKMPEFAMQGPSPLPSLTLKVLLPSGLKDPHEQLPLKSQDALANNKLSQSFYSVYPYLCVHLVH